MHSGAVWLFVLLVIAIVVTLARAGQASWTRPASWSLSRRWAAALLLVTLGQGVIGYLQYALGVPAWLVAVHMLGASLFVITTTGTVYALRLSPESRTTADPVRHPVATGHRSSSLPS
jgi:cytochrome c oxidase assembly protein subunit 15